MPHLLARRVRRAGCPVDGRPAHGCGRVRAMFALSIQNWWWTAHPAAH
ncbi:trp operon leader peptide [Streptomyces sp. NPDC050743]